jgi:hypothetical protein
MRGAGRKDTLMPYPLRISWEYLVGLSSDLKANANTATLTEELNARFL